MIPSTGGGEIANAVAPVSKHVNEVAPSCAPSDAIHAMRDEDLKNGEVKDEPNHKDLDTSAKASSQRDVAVNKDSCCEHGQKSDSKIYNSDVPGSPDTTLALPTFLSRQRHRNPSFTNQQPAQFARSSAPPSRKAFKVDPPTFTYGLTALHDSKQDAPVAAAATATRNLSPDQDAYIAPTHLGVKWSKRDVECLVECSRRWLCNTKRLKFQDDRKKDESPDATVQATSEFSLDQLDN